MLLQGREAHDCYARIVQMVAAAGRLRAGAIRDALPGVKAAAVAARLSRMERAGYLRRVATFRSCEGGREFEIGPTELPAFDDAAARDVYDFVRSSYSVLVAAGSAGMTAATLHSGMNESRPLAVTCNRLAVWEAAGRVACDRSRRPHVWRALMPSYPSFDELVCDESARRASQTVPEAAREAAARACATKRLLGSMVVAPWLWGLIKDDHPPSEIMSEPLIPAGGTRSTSEVRQCQSE